MSYSESNEIIEDFLEADDSIRGQNFVCLSFVSPENVLKDKKINKVLGFEKNTKYLKRYVALYVLFRSQLNLY